MLTTKRKPASVGEILVEEFMEPMGLQKVHWPRPWVCSMRAVRGGCITAAPYASRA